MFKFSIIPRPEKFFALFEQSAHNALKMAQQLRDAGNIWENVPERVGIINDLESQGDAITHLIIRELHHNYLTPFDREDIVRLANSLDNVADSIYSAADSMLLYKVDRPGKMANQLAEIIVQVMAEVETAVSELRHGIDQKKTLAQCMEINRLENSADDIYRMALAELFSDLTDIIYAIKWRDIYEHMESAIDRCEDVANALEGVALKYG